MRLIKSKEISNYVNTNPSESARIIPKLLENILNELNYKTNNIVYSVIPSDDDIIQIGVDGYLVLSENIDIFPKGKTFVEIGTGKNVIAKANSDLKKRNIEIEDKNNTNYIFLTPLPWESRKISRQKWMIEVAKEWKSALLIDSTVLEDLLERCFYTSLWFYEVISKSRINIRTIEKVEKDIIETTYNNFSLSLFDYEDTEFEQELINSLSNAKNEMIRFCGETREETVFYMLFLLNKNEYFKNKTIVIDSIEDWISIKKDHFIEGYYLIANFTYSSIEFIPNNVNIIIGGKEDYIDCRNAVVLKSRISNNLRKKLEEKISDLDEIDDIMKNCLGNKYSLLKRKIFKGKFDPKWVANIVNKEILVPALLINSWSKNNKGDIEVIEELGGNQYLSKIENIICMEDPFVAYVEHNGKYLVANNYEAWDILFNYITDDYLLNFKKVVKKILKYDSPVYKLEPEKRNFSSLYLKDKVYYSDTIKTGVIRTMIFYNQYSYRKTGIRKNIFEDVLSEYYGNINSELEWLNASPFFDLLVEIDPKLFLEKIKESIEEHSKGLNSLFIETDDIITKRANHYNLLWALEKTLHLEDYVFESLDIIASLADNNYKINSGNSPLNSLFRAFLGWDNLINVKFSEKHKLLEKILDKHIIGFELIKQVLPKRSGENWTYLCKPEYLEFELKNKITRKEIFENFKQYYLIFLKSYSNELSKIAYLYDENVFMYYEIADLVYSATKDMVKRSDSDEDKYQLEENIRQSLHGYYRFKNEVWHMNEKDLKEQNEILNMIVYDDISYKYLYLFDNYTPYIIVDMNEEEYERKEIEENYRKNAILELNNIKNYDFFDIVKIIHTSKNCHIIGEYIAKYSELNQEEIISFIKKLAGNETMQNILIHYIWEINKKYGFENIIEIIEQKDFASEKYTTLKVEFLIRRNIEKKLIDYISINKEIEEKFWQNFNPYVKVDTEYQDLVFAKLNEYRNYKLCLEFLHINKIMDSKKHFIVLKELYKNLKANTMDSHYINQSFKLIYKSNEINRKDVIDLEIIYYKILDETKKLKYFQEEILKDTQYLVELIGIAYKKENEPKIQLSERDQSIALNCYEIIQNLHDVKFYDSTSIEWAGRFLSETKKNNQTRVGENILGRLLANHTVGADGIFPNEISRDIIERFYSKNLSSGFQTQVFNSRGVYSGSSGEEEKKISERYNNWAQQLKLEYPNTSRILKEVSETYHNEYLRERAESNWWEN